MQAAVGCAQLKKLPEFSKRRRENFAHLRSLLEDMQDSFILPEACPDSNPSWFGFLITCREGVDKNKVVAYLEEHGVQTRMLFSGNLIKQPCFDDMRDKKSGYRVPFELSVTDTIMEKSFWVGVYPGMTEEMIEYMAKMLKNGVK
jgi:CDP-6-deoxy-D-xylo-4-hexulose-3-dehydrase